MPEQSTQQAQLLGEIHGIVSVMRDNQKRQMEKLDNVDARLRDQESTAAKHGALYGGAMAIGVALMVEGAKEWLRQKTGGGGAG